MTPRTTKEWRYMMRIDVTAHPAEDIMMDLTGVRELQAENARLSTDRATMQTHIRGLQAQLEEARKLPVALLPEITKELITEWEFESNGSVADQMNRVLRRHFRQAADPPNPALDVEAVMAKIRTALHWDMEVYQDRIKDILYEHVTDTPAQPLQKMQQFAPADETLAAAVARVERETQRNTRRECADDLRLAAKQVEGPSRGYWEMLADHMERGE